jgi:hypothetical protein
MRNRCGGMSANLAHHDGAVVARVRRARLQARRVDQTQPDALHSGGDDANLRPTRALLRQLNTPRWC